MSATSSIHSSDPQQPNGYLGKPVGLLPQPTSHDGHMTQGSSEYDQAALVEDPFYNFSDMGESSIQAVLDPGNPNSISFIDENFIPVGNVGSESGEIPVGSEFNPELFNSILSTGDEILSRLESGSATSGSLSVGGASIGDEEGLEGHERVGSWDEGVTDAVFTPTGDVPGGE